MEKEYKNCYSNHIPWVNPPDYFKKNDENYEISYPDTKFIPQKVFCSLNKNFDRCSCRHLVAPARLAIHAEC